MPKDPRTLNEIIEVADCHLVPGWCGVSGKTVPLEKKLDNDLGSSCDVEMQRYLKVLTSDRIDGRLSMVGGSKTLSATWNLAEERFEVIPPGSKKKPESKLFEERALGEDAGSATVESFIGTDADGELAAVSAIHSAFLILHYIGCAAIFENTFNDYRKLFASAIEKNLSEEQRALVQATVSVDFQTNPARHVTNAPPAVEINAGGGPNEADLAAIRGQYDPDYDPGDGIATDFPEKSVVNKPDAIEVTVPYSKSIRALVRFPKKA